MQKSMNIFKKTFELYKHQEFMATKIKNKTIPKNLRWIGPTDDVCRDHKIFLINKLIFTNILKFCKWLKDFF